MSDLSKQAANFRTFMPADNVIFLSSPELWTHGHGPAHPLKPERLQRTQELLQELGLLESDHVQVLPPRHASPEELALFHTPGYIAAVQALDQDPSGLSLGAPPSRYNFGPGDNPIFTGMYDSERLKVGGALQAAELLLKGACRVAFSFGGGMHHAGPDFASGFCVFNDAAVAIHWLLRQGQRVAYVDIDVHHGDGVQDAFYKNPQVLTISIHQDGRTLFPGTGYVEETGIGDGIGYSANLPLPPYTSDETYLWAFQEIVPPLLERFQPDIVVTQLGVDTHFLDPLANLALTTHAQMALFQALEELSPTWLALGGGGYSLDVVPRAWALALCAMTGQEPAEELPSTYRTKYGGRWLHDRQPPKLELSTQRSVRHRVQAIVEQLKELHNLG